MSRCPMWSRSVPRRTNIQWDDAVPELSTATCPNCAGKFGVMVLSTTGTLVLPGTVNGCASSYLAEKVASL
ncbi:hypothetical protein J6590_048576 [Homalodisca vitripennis]|nr:hypothetical protein J6590_048576 [Homalodisca vitripennis]